ncbi:Formamidopyrimidine-DNA glycosylase [Maioricimonas rarisocia]|uniref:Formamidopyrimidine-DNA glycosylase n=1 Tax=Maioricimonas rarisocia TaxID=2528026 RepID=A0A517Z8Z4_9PLAN|nr:bifunctional DNA-formamidopyrimidine glycosylase/DNA-(apurinic or apyrimidinic site) lyase [Maioricimonas rarisocia]QDU38919.1 Formamidopyrimidine-DNA glycosylase [Maioricimonas rarisocia]
MPELPEVETMVRGIRPHVLGRTVSEVRACPCPCRPMSIEPALSRIARRIRGKTITDVRRRAKRVLLVFEHGDIIAIEPRMTGLMLISDPPSREHLRVVWEFADQDQGPPLWFWDRRGLGTIRLYDPDEYRSALDPPALGPDALEITVDELASACARTKRAIKPALLDQKLVAGVGNLYASEMLHVARIHPERSAHMLKRRQIVRLHQAMQDVLTEAIRYEGSTLGDGTYRNALNQDGSYQNAHRVYAKAGERCRTCNRGTVRRIVQTQRSTFFCPVCQRQSPRRGG